MDVIHSIHVSEVPAYEGPHAIPGLRFRTARQALSVSSFGLNVLEFEPHQEGYPEHDHASDGHEEVYVVLQGRLTLRTPDGDRTLVSGDMVRVPGSVRRKLVTGSEPAVVLAIGGTPGAAYQPSMGG